jgi:RNA polymerase sigma-70 factor (ECF subfamily)
LPSAARSTSRTSAGRRPPAPRDVSETAMSQGQSLGHVQNGQLGRIGKAVGAVPDNVEASRAVVPGRQPQSLPQLKSISLKRSGERAFEQLYRKHARDVYQYALAVLTNPADAEDVTQQTFLNAFRAIQRGERPLRPHNWLIVIAHNVCRMRWRQASHRPKEVALEEAPEPAATPQDQPGLDEVLQALTRLSFNQRAALVMRELEGRSYKEIASVLGVSVGAVEALLFRARRHLRLQKRALGILGTAPLPTSIASSLGIGGAATGGGAAVAGGAALGGDLLLKAAALVAVGAMTAGIGYRAIEAARPAQKPAALDASHAAAPVAAKHRARPPSHTRARAHRALTTRKATPAPTRQAAPTPAPPSDNVEQISPGNLAPQPALPTTVVKTPPLPVQPPALPALPVQTPKLPVLPPLPPLPPLK